MDAGQTDNTHERRGERELVRRLQRELAEKPARGVAGAGLGFGDDLAPLGSDQTGILWSTDLLSEGVDFEAGRHSWRDIGRKAMAVNLSDCAAMAAVPFSALCAVCLHESLSMDDALDLVRGAHEFGLRFGCPIVGGDTNSWDKPTVVAVTVAARPPVGLTPVRRDGARPDDRIFLSGPVGGSILGRHMCFEPRIETALAIRRRLSPHAMIDVSDGLAIDLARLLEASGCGAVLEELLLEAAVHPDARRLAESDGSSPREHALHDGEDFELIVTLPASAPQEACEQLGLLPLGRITRRAEMVLAHADGSRVAIEPRGWEHFK